MADYALFLEPDETAYDLFARVVVEPVYLGIPFLDQAISLRPGHVIELSGPSGTAKSELLVHAAATCILPKHQHGISYGGREENTLYIDLDIKFDLLRLIKLLQVLEFRVQAAQQAQSRQAPTDQLLTECLERFHLVQCHSSFQFLAVLKTLKPTLTALQNSGGMRLLLIDNMAAFYWLDKACKPLPSTAGTALQGGALTLQAVHAAVASELRLIMQHHKLAVLTAKHALLSAPVPPTGGPMVASYREFLPHSWHDLVTHRVMLRRAKGSLPSRRGQPTEQGSHHFEAQHLDASLAASGYMARFAVMGGRLLV